MKNVVPLVVLLNLLGSQSDVLSQADFAVRPDQLWIPVGISSPSGEQVLNLETTLYRPKGEGPHPLVIFSHGSTGHGQIDARETQRSYSVAKLFVDRGFAVLVPMRRGRGLSDGKYSEPEDCDDAAASNGVASAIEDTDAVLKFAKGLTFIDSSRIVLSGHSRGGFLSVIYAARRPEVAKGVINFSGGWMSGRCPTNFNVSMYKEAGNTTKTPMLWLYAENDSFYSPSAIKIYESAFKEAGGKVVFHLYTPVEPNGHFLIRHIDVWKNDFDTFLDNLGFIR